MVTSADAARFDDTFEGVDRIVAFGDIHGDYDQFLRLLKQAELIDESLTWTGGDAHFVQIGDILDRGPDSRKIADLIMNLEGQAKRAGGRVHFVIGNHEAMNLVGDLRYVHAGEYEAFAGPGAERNQDASYRAHVRRIKNTRPKREWPDFDDAYEAKWKAEHPLGWAELRTAWGPKGDYGDWLLDQPAVLKINDMLFVHGGLGPTFLEADLAWLNDAVYSDLRRGIYNANGVAFDQEGPLWYRGLAWGEEETEGPHVDALLAKHGVNHIVIAHTPVTGAILPRFGDKVLAIDVGLGQHYGRRDAYLEVTDGQLRSIHRGRRLVIPSEGGEALLDYLKEAAALDPQPSPIEKKIRALELETN